MADITDGAAIYYCNTTIRPLADKLMQFYYAAIQASNDFTAKGLGPLIPNDGTAIVIDGASADGRTKITGADVNILLANSAAIVASLQANSNLIFNQTDKISVNP